MKAPFAGATPIAAFPHKPERRERSSSSLELVTPGDEPGMSLRDYFAARAMCAFIVNRDRPDEPTSTYLDTVDIVAVAYGAYRVADAMLKAREA
jgi:hypothetical protein